MNVWESDALVYGRLFIDAVLSAFKTVPAAALLATAKVRLSKDPNFGPTPESKIADFTVSECDFSGYTAGGVALVMSGPVNLSTKYEGMLADANFVAAAATPFVANSVYGYWVDDGTNVVAAERFPTGTTGTLTKPGDFLALTVILGLSNFTDQLP